MTRNDAIQNRLRDAPMWVHAAAWGSFALPTLASIVLFYAYRDGDIWAKWLGANEAATRWPTGIETHFAERIYGASIFRTPANTLSNLAYVLVGLYILAYTLYDFRRPTSRQDPYAVRRPALMAYFGFTCLLLGFGSGYMHASLSSNGHWYDLLGMYGSLVAIVALHWGRWFPDLRLGSFRLPSPFILIPAAMAVTYYLALNDGPFGYRRIMVALFATIMMSFCVDIASRRTRIEHRWHILALLAFIVAFAIWNLTNAGRFSGPEAWLQGHAVWHVLTGVSLGCMAILYRSEIEASAHETDSSRAAGTLNPALDAAQN